MNKNAHADENTKATLSLLIEKAYLDKKHINSALAIANLEPDESEWQQFIHQLILFAGVLALVSGLIFFIAANWAFLATIGKFALAQAAVVTAVIGFVLFSQKRLVASACLIAGILSVGALMALFGQTYQTGADPWQLFFNWALVITPWVLVSRFSAVWLIWVAIWNLALHLYIEAFYTYELQFYSGLVLNTFILVSWQIALSTRKFSWLNNSWAINLLALAPTAYGTMLVSYGVFEDEFLGIAFWLAWLTSVWLFSYYRARCLFVLAGAAFSIIIALNAAIIHWLSMDETSMFLLLILANIGAGTGAALVLKKWWKEQTHKPHGAESD